MPPSAVKAQREMRTRAAPVTATAAVGENDQSPPDGATNFELPQPQDRNLAAFVEFRFKSEGRAYSSGTPVQVFKRPN